MFFIHHFIRPIWSALFKGIYFIFSLFKLLNKKNREKYKTNKNFYNSIDCIETLQNFFRTVYNYEWDGWRGLFDHDNSELEFLIDFGDCDDVATYSLKKMKLFKGIKKCFKVGLIGPRINSWHYDTYFETDTGCYLFNYGIFIKGNSLKDCIDNISGWDLFPLGKTKFWRCFW